MEFIFLILIFLIILYIYIRNENKVFNPTKIVRRNDRSHEAIIENTLIDTMHQLYINAENIIDKLNNLTHISIPLLKKQFETDITYGLDTNLKGFENNLDKIHEIAIRHKFDELFMTFMNRYDKILNDEWLNSKSEFIIIQMYKNTCESLKVLINKTAYAISLDNKERLMQN